MYLEVLPAGGKFWRLKYRFEGEKKRLSFGAYPAHWLERSSRTSGQSPETVCQWYRPRRSEEDAEGCMHLLKDGRNCLTAIVPINTHLIYLSCTMPDTLIFFFCIFIYGEGGGFRWMDIGASPFYARNPEFFPCFLADAIASNPTAFGQDQ
jgi:hypothetical protein